MGAQSKIRIHTPYTEAELDKSTQFAYTRALREFSQLPDCKSDVHAFARKKQELLRILHVANNAEKFDKEKPRALRKEMRDDFFGECREIGEYFSAWLKGENARIKAIDEKLNAMTTA